MSEHLGRATRRIALRFTLVAASVVWSACGGGSVATEPSGEAGEPENGEQRYVVEYLGREVDLEPYFDGFRYGRFMPNYDAGELFYMEDTEDQRLLRALPFEAGVSSELDLTAGTLISDADWSTRNLWGIQYNEPSGDLLLFADERNAEVMNLYRLDPETRVITQLTFAPYVYGAHQDPTGRFLAYIPRYGDEEPFRTCLNILDLTTGDDVEVVCDSAEERFTWSTVAWSPDGAHVVLELTHEGDRARPNLALVELSEVDGGGQARAEVLLPEVVRHRMGLLEDWIDDRRFGYVSGETGFVNFYVYDVEASEAQQVTHIEEETSRFEIVEVEGEQLLLVVLDRPHENVLEVYQLDSGDRLASHVFNATVYMGDTTGNHASAVLSSLSTPFQLVEVTVDRPTDGSGAVDVSVALRAEVPDDLRERITQCEVRRVEIPTFDVDPTTGESRLLHAFLLTPREQRSPEQRLARITSFYGGGNRFSAEAQMLCEAGITTLSPSPRGSWGFGTEFAALNDGDLGGDEIIDIIYAGRWLESELGLDPSQIGVYGGSHGGYATMRLLTFPPETNDRGESFDWGFGLSHAGFSNILTFYEACNIPDWVTLEAGDPETEADKLLDRSPVSHLELLRAPILLTHGENDSRVPVTESRQFVAAAEDAGRADLVTYVELEGQGHGISGLPNRLRYYQTVLTFLERVALANSARLARGD